MVHITFFLNTGLSSSEDSISVALEAALEANYCAVLGQLHPVGKLTAIKASLTLFYLSYYLSLMVSISQGALMVVS